MSETKQRDLVDYLQWLFTLAIAVGGFYLNWQQGELRDRQAEIDQRSQRERMIQLFADKTFSYVDEMKMKDEDKQDVMIELIDIITEINVSETGEIAEQDRLNLYNKQKSLIPLRLALVTGNDDILAHISTNQDKQDLWVEFAERSNNDGVRNTAIRTLGQIYRRANITATLPRGESPTADGYRYAIEKILSISRDLTDEATVATAEKAIAGIHDAIVESGQSDDESLQALLRRANSGLRSQRVSSIGDAAFAGVRPEQTGAVQQTLQQSVNALQSLELTSAPTGVGAGARAAEISKLVASLTSEDTAERRGARSKLIEIGNPAIGQLLDAVAEAGEDTRYRLGLGAAYVLYRMEQPVAIPKGSEGVKAAIRLIGDSQADIRKYASEFLMKLYDEQSIEAVYPVLKEIVENERDNGNMLYNAVVVLGTWMRVLPSSLDVTRDSIRVDLVTLRTDLQKTESKWSRTLKLINQMLAD